MEKYYIFGSVIISLCLTVPPYAAKQYGYLFVSFEAGGKLKLDLIDGMF
jgi:hypothetical protein